MARNVRAKRSRKVSTLQKILQVDTIKVICILLILFLVFLISFSITKILIVSASKDAINYDMEKVVNLDNSTKNETSSENIMSDYTTPELLNDGNAEDTSTAFDGSRSFTLCAIGDVMCHNTQYMDAYNKSTGEYDFSYVFNDIVKYTQSPDITIGSLETSFAGSEVGYSNYPRFNSPDNLAYCLRRIGVDILSTAGNHCLDMGFSGLSKNCFC